MSISRTTASILSAIFCLGIALPLLPASAQSQKASVRYEEKKRQTNDIAVSIVVSGLTCTCARFAEDIRNVVNDLRPDGIRVLPVLGVGGLQNLNDVLFLKGIDMGVVDEDNLLLLKKRDPQLYANIEQSVQYITKLYNSEFHVLARGDIKSFDDLRGKKVSFNLKDSQTEVTAQIIFDMLKLDVQRVNYDNDEALKKLRSGEISAMIILSGAPQAAVVKVGKDENIHLLSLDERSLPGHDLHPMFAKYLPIELTHEQYPALIPQGQTVSTVGNRSLLGHLCVAGELRALQQDRQVRARVLRQDRPVPRRIAASQVGRDQPGGRDAGLDPLQAGGRLAGRAPERGAQAGVRPVRAEQHHGGPEGSLGPRPGGAVRQVPAIPAIADHLAVGRQIAADTIATRKCPASSRAFLFGALARLGRRPSSRCVPDGEQRTR